MPVDYNYEVILTLGKHIAKFLKSSKIVEEIENSYPFSEKSYKKIIKLIDKEFKNIMFDLEKETEKEIVEGFLNLLKNISTNKEIDEITYRISKEFNEYYSKSDITGFLKVLKKYQKELAKLFKSEKSLKASFLDSFLKKDKKNYKNELIELLNKEEELQQIREELISTIEIILKNISSFLETDELLKQKLKNLKEDLKNLETIENVKRFKNEIKDIFVKLGIIERVLEEEKEELKGIILLMAESLKELLGNSNEFSKTIDNFIEKIQATDDIEEIKKFKMELLNATTILKQKTKEVHLKLKKADEMLKQANEKMKKLEEEMRKAKEKALYDGLTGAYNRAVFNDRIVKEVEKAKREKRNLSFLMIDIDHFKEINDNYGHQTGDAVLKILTQQIKKMIRNFDFFARYGGEEFALILPDSDIETAKKIAERIRKKIENTKFIYKQERIPVTISIGCTQLIPEDNEKSLIERADQALYEAKKSGRNKVVVK